MKSSKLQHPSSREASSSKLQIADGIFWNLKIGVSLVLGAWDLELLKTKQ
jgi:hypothetical protein